MRKGALQRSALPPLPLIHPDGAESLITKQHCCGVMGQNPVAAPWRGKSVAQTWWTDRCTGRGFKGKGAEAKCHQIQLRKTTKGSGIYRFLKFTGSEQIHQKEGYQHHCMFALPVFSVHLSGSAYAAMRLPLLADRGFEVPSESSHHAASFIDFMLRWAGSVLLPCSNLCCGCFRLLQRHGGTLPPTCCYQPISSSLDSVHTYLASPLGLVGHPVCESLHLGLQQVNSCGGQVTCPGLPPVTAGTDSCTLSDPEDGLSSLLLGLQDQFYNQCFPIR